jgi:hypothetical protein
MVLTPMDARSGRYLSASEIAGVVPAMTTSPVNSAPRSGTQPTPLVGCAVPDMDQLQSRWFELVARRRLGAIISL